MSLASYLAKKYLNKEVIKKNKSKEVENNVIHIIDNDLTGWKEIKPDLKKKPSIRGDSGKEVLGIEKYSKTGFKKLNESSWEKIEDPEASLLKSEDVPTVVMPDGQGEINCPVEELEDALIMLNGTRAGLQTAKQVEDDLKRRKDEEEKVFKKMDPKLTGKGAKTIYRDASGRRVDMELVMMERQRQKAKEEARKKLEYEMSQGEVQKREKEEAKKAMEEIKHMPFSRSIDDPELNRMLKEKERWNDPAATFLKKKQQSKRPVYQGYYSANRFGIAPGYRWDGVDRGNGFEKAWFAHQSEKKAQAAEAYAWSIEDM